MLEGSDKEDSKDGFNEEIKVEVIEDKSEQDGKDNREKEKKDHKEREQVFEENLPLRNKLSLVEEEKEDANEADESMENRPERRHLESLDEISDIYNPVHESGQISVG